MATLKKDIWITVETPLNPTANANNTIQLTKEQSGCCGDDAGTECAKAAAWASTAQLLVTLKVNDLDGVEQTRALTAATSDSAVIMPQLAEFLDDLGYIVVKSELVDRVDYGGNTRVLLIGKNAPAFKLVDNDPTTTTSEAWCDQSPLCQFTFQTDGNGDNAVDIVINGTASTVGKFDMTTSAAAVQDLLAAGITVDTWVVKNTDAGYFEVTIWMEPNDVVFIDGSEGEKVECRKYWAKA